MSRSAVSSEQRASLANLEVDTTRVRLPDSIRRDFQAFVSATAAEEVNTKALGIRNRTKDQILVSLSASYQL